nr:hypothetical protein [uncultured Cohaesibacter sp.]
MNSNRLEQLTQKLEHSLDCLAELSAINKAHSLEISSQRNDASRVPGKCFRADPYCELDTAAALHKAIDCIEETVGKISDEIDQPWNRRPLRKVDEAISSELAMCLGKVTLHHPFQPFLRGYLEPCETRVVAPFLPVGLVQYLEKIPYVRGSLKRENHGHWGYHYHYYDTKERRSDTLLTFDNDPTTNCPNATPCKPHTACNQGCLPQLKWEKHSEKGTIKAKMGRWGDEKRESAYSVCKPDTLKWDLSKFKHPKSDASDLWPR